MHREECPAQVAKDEDKIEISDSTTAEKHNTFGNGRDCLGVDVGPSLGLILQDSRESSPPSDKLQ